LAGPTRTRVVVGAQTGVMSVFSRGSRLGDRYRLLDPLGAGGMSQVWRAVDELLDRLVAVKVLAAPLTTDSDLREAIWREARAVARLPADFRAAFRHPEFRATLSAYPSSAVASPHLFQKVAVPGICVDR
jgi:serine/threonine protein kinase